MEPRIVNRSSHGDACGRTIIFLSRLCRVGGVNRANFFSPLVATLGRRDSVRVSVSQLQ